MKNITSICNVCGCSVNSCAFYTLPITFCANGDVTANAGVYHFSPLPRGFLDRLCEGQVN